MTKKSIEKQISNFEQTFEEIYKVLNDFEGKTEYRFHPIINGMRDVMSRAEKQRVKIILDDTNLTSGRRR